MVTVVVIMAVASLIAAILSLMSRCPLGVTVLLIAITVVLSVLPLTDKIALP